MKKFILGLIVGIAIMITGTIYADEGLQKIEAYLRPTLPITLNGQAVTLESPPVVYDGSTYLKLRDVAGLTGLEVKWNDKTQTVELGTAKGVTTLSTTISTAVTTPTETTYSGLKAITDNGETYFSIFDYGRKFDPYVWGFDAATNAVFLAETDKGTTTIKKKVVEFKKDEPNALIIYKGESFVNIRYYHEY
jgi:hypothetical protein